MIKEFTEQKLKKIYHQFYKKDYRPLKSAKNLKVEPWAYIRVKNEIATLETCLNSISSVISNGVIGFNDCTDGSIDVIKDFCKRNEGFIAIDYKHEIVPLHDIRYLGDLEDENTFSGYCNTILSKIPKGEWLIKIDADHVFDEERLKKFLRYPKKRDESIILSNLNLHCDGTQVWVRKDYPISAGDMWMINNNNLEFVMDKKYIGERFYCVEKLTHNKRKRIFTDLINYHFTYLKSGKSAPVDNLIEFDVFLEKVLPTLPMGYLLPKEMLDKQRILNIYNKFQI